MSENTGKVFNKNAFFAKMNQQKENLKEGVNNVRGSEGYKNVMEKRDELAKNASAGVTSGFDRLGFGNKQQREEQGTRAKEGVLNLFSGVKNRLGTGLQNLQQEGKDRRNQQVGGRKTKKSRRNKRKSTRKTRKNKRKTKKSKKSKRKSRKSRRK